MTTKITIKNNASIRIEGSFEIYDHLGNRFDLGGREAVSLCRCANSSKQPFCDGSHAKCNFSSEVRAFDLPKVEK